jgi:hypothetical protein
MTPAQKSPSLLICFGIPALFLTAGLVFAGFYGYREVPPLQVPIAEGVLSPEFRTTIAAPGKYTIVVKREKSAEEAKEGASFFQLPPGGRVHVYRDKTGEELDLNTMSQAIMLRGAIDDGTLGVFEVPSPEEALLIKSSGVPEALAVAIVPESHGRRMKVMRNVLGILAITISSSITVLIVLIHRRQVSLLEDSGHH